MDSPDEGALGALQSLQNLGILGIGAYERASLGAGLEDLIVVLLAFEIFARIVGAKGATVGSWPPRDGAAEVFFAADLEQSVRSTGAVFLFPLAVKHGIGGREKHIIGDIAKA
jgi:hypothetical protein